MDSIDMTTTKELDLFLNFKYKKVKQTVLVPIRDNS